MNETLQQIYDNVLEGRADPAVENVQGALDAGIEPSTILNEALIAAMAEVGQRFETGDYFVPDMLVSARAMKAALEVVKPQLAQGAAHAVGTVVIGTVFGDLHDIGKNLVAIMFEGAGFNVVDLGVDVTPEAFVEAVRRENADLLAISGLLTTTIPNMQRTIESLTAAGLRDQVKVFVGGAPVTQAYADEIGADGYADDASRAATLAKQVVEAARVEQVP